MIALLAIMPAALAPPTPAQPLPAIELIATGAISTATPLHRLRVGGLSGLAHHQGRWLAISDDKEGAPRIYELALKLDPTSPTVEASVIGVFTLDAQDLSDAEAIALTDDAAFIAFERRCAVASFEFPAARPGAPASLALRQRFITPEPIASGFRKNRAFESILVRPTNPPEIWAFTESATRPDGAEATTTRGAISRVAVWPIDRPELARQHAYLSLPRPANTLAILPSYNSLVDAAPIDATHLLTLERSFSIGAGYDAAIRRVTIRNNETELSSVPALEPRPRNFSPLNVETIATLQSLGAPTTVNYEAIALGPSIDDPRAGRWLIILADDNFGADGQPSNVILAMRFGGASSASVSAPALEPEPAHEADR